jgi:Domain of unknown function (DUF4326)
MPERVQLRRTRGWRKPPGTIVVARPSRWGNPWRIDPTGASPSSVLDRATAVARFRSMMESDYDASKYPSREEIRAQLAGRDLACWCPLGGPCHADVLLKIANT